MPPPPTTDSRAASLNTAQGRYFYGWTILAVSIILVAIAYGIRFSFGVFFKSLEADFGLSRALTSGVFSVYMMLGSFFAVLGGWLADRRGPRIVFFVMAFFALAGLSLTSLVTELWQIFLTYSLLVAMGSGPTYVVATSLISKWFKKRRGLALGIVTSGVGLGSILMAPIAAYLIGGFGWRTSFLALGIIAFVVMIPCSLFLKKAPEEEANPPESKQPIPHPVSSHSQVTAVKQFSALQAVKSRNFGLLFVLWIFYAYCLFTVMTHIVPHAIDLGISPIQAATIISVMGFVNVPMRIFMGMVTDKVGRKQAALIATSLMVIALAWLTQASSLWMFYAFAAVFGAGYGGLAPPTTAIVGDTFGIKHIGVIMGLLEIGWTSGAAIGPALSGYIFDVTGSYDNAFLLAVLSALMIIVTVLFLKIPAHKRD